MKKIIKIGIIIMLCVSSINVYYAIPRKINLTYYGIRYRTENHHQEKKVVVNIDGTYRKRFRNTDFFEGYVIVDGVVLDATRNATGLFIGGPSRMIGYTNKDNRTFVYGQIFVDDNFDKLTICVQEKKLYGLNNETGDIVISAPANNRIDALRISNELMKDVLVESLK